MRFENPHGSEYKIQKEYDEDVYLIHRIEDQNFLEHHGIRGQKWGVITKEYEPVAVDRRRTRFWNPIAKVRAANAQRAARDAADLQKKREDRQAWLEKRDQRIATAGKILGISSLLLTMYGGYKLSGMKMNGKQSLKSLLNIVPTKAERGGLMQKGLLAGMAKQQASTSGLAKIKQTFERAGGILTGQRYRKHIQTAKNLIQKLSSTTMEYVDELKNKRR